mgnify:CR=1 FL=1
MTITELLLVNFRKHARLRIPFKNGITAIVGKNGAGKSSVVEAILFALTGKLYPGTTKDDAIKRGCDTGYVSLSFTLNGKVGKLTRHLDVSKLQLEYDKQSLKKSSEVKELWDSLLQVNTEIVERVIIAQQGNIPLLFCGDQTVREKIFQKIFLVPNTEKMRKIIFDKYIKQCPPVIPLEDIDQLQLLHDKLDAELSVLNYELLQIKVKSNKELDELKNRLNFIDKCIEDRGKIAQINDALDEVNVEEGVVLREIAESKELLASIRITDYEKQYNTQLQQKSLFEQKQKIETQLKNITFPFSEPQYEELKDAAKKLEEEVHALDIRLLENKINLGTLKQQLAGFSSLHDRSTCHACGQALDDVKKLIASLEVNKQELELLQKTIQAEHIDKAKDLDELFGLLAEYDKVTQLRSQLEASMEHFKIVSFDVEELDFYKDVIDQYREAEKTHRDKEMKLTKIKGRAGILKQQLVSLAIYDGTRNIMEEREAVLAEINKHNEDTRILQQKQISYRVKQYELENVKDRIETNTKNREKNEKRDAYAKALNQVHDILHSSNFPRKLILDYADVVSEHLQSKLDNFSIPYKVRVADNFKIEMIDENNYVMPSVSGGQQMIIGISLHLALHELFSQAFPLMILDEGTTHLDEENRQAYFDVLKSLKSEDKAKPKQIIVIDHDPGIAGVVDNIVEIKLEDD